MEHTETCTCEECINTNKLNNMSWWVFWEHRGYMEDPKSFESYEKALKFAQKEKSFCMPYIVFGKVLETYSSEFKVRELKGKEIV
jgi:hypothetical protein